LSIELLRKAHAERWVALRCAPLNKDEKGFSDFEPDCGKGPWMSLPRGASVLLFSYGTLQQANVQLATFGRLLEGRADQLVGFAVMPLEITDAKVVAVSGAAIHTIARYSGDPADVIRGVVFSITPAELEAADSYEVSAARIEVELASGTKAFAYVSRETGGVARQSAG
jgi:hypothetical protein